MYMYTGKCKCTYMYTGIGICNYIIRFVLFIYQNI